MVQTAGSNMTCAALCQRNTNTTFLCYFARAETNTCTIRLFDRFDSIRMLLQLFELRLGGIPICSHITVLFQYSGGI